jgi:hypothetical protein
MELKPSRLGIGGGRTQALGPLRQMVQRVSTLAKKRTSVGVDSHPSGKNKNAARVGHPAELGKISQKL